MEEENFIQSRLSMKRKSQAQMGRLYMRPGLCMYVPNSLIVGESVEVSEFGPVVTKLARRSQPGSSEAHRTHANSNTFSDWSPLDDGIKIVLPNGSDRVPSREEVDAYIFDTLNKPTTKRRLPVFEALCVGK